MSAPTTPVDGTAGEPRPLLVCDDEEVVEDVLRLAAAAGVAIDLMPTAGAARAPWRDAPLVLVGHDAVPEALRLRMPRRNQLFVVCFADDEHLLRQSVTLGAEQVCVLPRQETVLIDLLADASESAGEPADLVCVVGGRGGAGASVTAAALALTAMRMDRRPLLVDGDPLGGGIDLVVGGEDAEGLRWPDLANTRGRVNGTALRAALPNVDQLTVLSWDRGEDLDISVDAMRTILSAATRVSDLVVVDLPRRVDEAVAEALSRSTVTLLVVPAEVRAVASAARVVHGIRQHAADIRVLVRGPAPTGLSADVVTGALRLPAAGTIRPEPGLDAMLDNGRPPVTRLKGPLATFCRNFLLALESERRAA